MHQTIHPLLNGTHLNTCTLGFKGFTGDQHFFYFCHDGACIRLNIPPQIQFQISISLLCDFAIPFTLTDWENMSNMYISKQKTTSMCAHAAMCPCLHFLFFAFCNRSNWTTKCGTCWNVFFFFLLNIYNTLNFNIQQSEAGSIWSMFKRSLKQISANNPKTQSKSRSISRQGSESQSILQTRTKDDPE